MKMLISYLEVCIHVEKKANVEKYILCEHFHVYVKVVNQFWKCPIHRWHYFVFHMLNF